MDDNQIGISPGSLDAIQDDAAAGVRVVAAEGAVTQAERLTTIRAWRKDPDFRPDLNQGFLASDRLEMKIFPDRSAALPWLGQA